MHSWLKKDFRGASPPAATRLGQEFAIDTIRSAKWTADLADRGAPRQTAVATTQTKDSEESAAATEPAAAEEARNSRGKWTETPSS